ncbi:YidC/Oxa1 family membrane protein insertase [Candidatus Lucifugimonas marina]|uniref:Membrane protein insertase YidC n=1 Tax=Candidatus Lucifugimonas marina TaxID=3038979 RepID=A0AAJ6CU75_9CHLR|nr:membrane protein insertase YidC [SAR202 cluster bacterium JH702]MDG0870057.1 membrane protein insertase YidC [SAR202 cluster bacterium JH639]WFG36379.1 membrane protein insertase YidC [SAR202 cluster bacterium JH545]WFG40312.1 membrane protein insertase YidC [SAR202 cluster bacterium JH1073]
MEIFGILWQEVIMRPMINSLALLYQLLFSNFGISIIVFTVLIRLAMIPLTVRQTRQMKKMQSIQPKLKAIQDKYKGKKGDARRQMSSETMGLYKEAGVSPVGCLGPMIIQMPIWIGFYRAILRTMPSTPEGMANLSDLFYSWNPAITAVPFDSQFLGLSLVDLVSAAAMPWNYALPVLVGASMFLQQKMTTNPTTDPRQRQTNQMMLWMMPIMFGAFTWQFPAGLAVYILFSNIVGVVIQYYVSGKQPIELFGRSYLGTDESRALRVKELAAMASGESEPTPDPEESDEDDQSTEVLGKDSRRSDRNRSRRTGRRTRRRRNKGN